MQSLNINKSRLQKQVLRLVLAKSLTGVNLDNHF